MRPANPRWPIRPGVSVTRQVWQDNSGGRRKQASVAESVSPTVGRAVPSLVQIARSPSLKVRRTP
jgi:hypothetical protein